MKRTILIIAGLLMCVGCSHVNVDTPVDTQDIQQEISIEPEYLKGHYSYTKVFPEGYKYFIQHVQTIDNEYFVTGIITVDGNIDSMHVWDRSYPDSIYQHWINKSPELANSFRDRYNSMISCFDTNAITCEIYPAQ